MFFDVVVRLENYFQIISMKIWIKFSWRYFFATVSLRFVVVIALKSSFKTYSKRAWDKNQKQENKLYFGLKNGSKFWKILFFFNFSKKTIIF